MTLKADLSDLPPAAGTRDSDGLNPDPQPRFVQLLAQQWHDQADDYKATAKGTTLRHSDAGKCARALGYGAAGFPRSDPMDLTGHWNTTLGTIVHEHWQNALRAAYPDAEVEVRCQVDGVDASGHIDAVIRHDGRTIAYEAKTIGGYGFKAAIGRARRGTPAEGPKHEHVLQAALNALAVGADEMVVGYLAKECISVNQAGGLDEVGRFAAEWTFTREEYEPLARKEAKRLQAVADLVATGVLPPRKIPNPDMPKRAEITDPSKGTWQEVDDDGTVLNVGSYWMCSYCNFQSLCATTEPGRIPVDSVTPVTVGEVA